MVERHNCLTLGGVGGGVAPYVIFQQITHGNTVSESYDPYYFAGWQIFYFNLVPSRLFHSF